MSRTPNRSHHRKSWKRIHLRHCTDCPKPFAWRIQLVRQVILVQGKAEGRFKDVDGNDDEEKFQLASAMLSYINASSIGMSDGMDFVEDCLNADECRRIFEMIFDAMEQKQHYDMMMGNQ